MAMISREQFDQMKNEFGQYGSWAVWADGMPGAAVKDGIDDLSIFEDEETISQLHNDYVIVALNISGPIASIFGNFHSDKSTNTDFKMRHAFRDTPLWGSYITDILKDTEEVDSSKIAQDRQKYVDDIGVHALKFSKELSILGAEDAKIVVFGSEAEYFVDLALKHLGKSNEVIRIYHYAHYINMEDCRQHVHDKLSFPDQ